MSGRKPRFPNGGTVGVSARSFHEGGSSSSKFSSNEPLALWGGTVEGGLRVACCFDFPAGAYLLNG